MLPSISLSVKEKMSHTGQSCALKLFEFQHINLNESLMFTDFAVLCKADLEWVKNFLNKCFYTREHRKFLKVN